MIIETLCMLSLSLASSQANSKPLPPEVVVYEKSINDGTEKKPIDSFAKIITNDFDLLQPVADTYAKAIPSKVVKAAKELTVRFPGKEAEIIRALIISSPENAEEIACSAIHASPDANTIVSIISSTYDLIPDDNILDVVDCALEANSEIAHSRLMRAAGLQQENSSTTTVIDRDAPRVNSTLFSVSSLASDDGT